MRIIISPAKGMIDDNEILSSNGKPVLLKNSEEILNYLKSLSYEQLKQLWGCNEKLALFNYQRLLKMDLNTNLTAAILAYDGIAFKYMAPSVFDDKQFEYVQNHLRIISGFYGVVKPMDGIKPYRLEMQAKAKVNGKNDLYHYWGNLIYEEIQNGNKDRIIINLASKEYSKCVEDYLTDTDVFVNCVFGELEKGKIVQKGVYAKMARGEMVRFLAEINAKSIEDIKMFDRLNYQYHPELSDENNLVFLR